MRKIYLNLLLVIVCNSFGQKSRNVTVDYTLYLGEQNNKKSIKSEISEAINKESGNVKFKLYVNDTISYFIENNGISSANLSTSLAIGKTNYLTPIYFDIHNTFIFKNDPDFTFFDKNEYLIQKKGIDNWTITNETKIIDGKVCYKAISQDHYYHNKNRKIDFEVLAWFCPEIPFKFGPVYYNNLPGLILEISYLDLKLIATSIQYELDMKKIIKPTGLNKITELEYAIKLEDKMAGMVEELKKQQGK